MGSARLAPPPDGAIDRGGFDDQWPDSAEAGLLVTHPAGLVLLEETAGDISAAKAVNPSRMSSNPLAREMKMNAIRFMA
jgi:hypothetical protein